MAKSPHPTGFSPVTSTNVGIRPLSNPYKIEVVITSLIKMLELPNFDNMNAYII